MRPREPLHALRRGRLASLRPTRAGPADGRGTLGAAALVQAQAGGTLGVDALIQRLLGSADDDGAPGPGAYSNHGRINVLRAVR